MELTKATIWNVKIGKNTNLKVLTIEQGKRQPSLCEGCPAPCCQGLFRPVLTAKEFMSKKFKVAFAPLPPSLKKQKVPADFVVTLAMGEHGCFYFDWETRRCGLWPNPPQACLAYDCRQDTRSEIFSFAQKRIKEFSRKTIV